MEKEGSQGGRAVRLSAVGVVIVGALIAGGIAAAPRASERGAGAGGVWLPAHAAGRSSVSAADTGIKSIPSSQGPYRAGAVLVAFRPGVSGSRELAIERGVGARSARSLGPAVRAVRRAGAAGKSEPVLLGVSSHAVPAAVRALRRDPGVAYAEPDYLMHASATPNDPSFALQWADNNTGQSIPTQNAEEVLGPPANGTPGADDRALAAWGISTGSRSIVIGETDTGVNYTHADLASNVWSNPGGIGGCAAGTRGYNVLTSTCEPMDDDTAYGGHGTHVAGIMGAVGNNGVGVAGMNWQTSILPVKWLDSSASGSTSGLIAALQWLVAAKQAGVNIRVVNDSATFVGTAYSQALSEEIDTLGANNILFVTAAGNTGNNNDEAAVRRYPCGYDRPTEICVTASDNNDKLPSWANYGPHTVDLAAPGVSIYSTLRNGGYGYLSGGSMASPQVAGAAALILSVSPSLSPTALKADILENVDKLPALSGKVITGGRLNVCKALPGCTSQPAPSTFGKTAVGASSDKFLANRKRVSRYALPTAGSVTKLSIYLAPTSTSGQQLLKGVVYADASGAPGALLGVSEPLTFKSTNTAGWYDLLLSAPLKLSAGNYWIGAITGASSNVAGFRYDSASGARDYNANAYTAGPTNPFGSVSTDSEQTSLYATYTTGADTTAPTQPQSVIATPVGSSQINLSWAPSSDDVGVAGYTIRRNGAVLTSTTGTATGYSDTGLSPATTYTYTVDAYDAAGNHSAQSEPASATTASASSVQHYEYVFASRAIDVYDMGNGQKPVKTISLPQAATDIRGAVASPTTHMLYVSYGGDGGANGGGTILAYDLVKETTAWTQSYSEGVDSMAITPDGKTIYLPVGEASSASTWDVVNAANGQILSRVEGGKAPHNTIVSLNGEHVYMGGREASYLTVANTSTNQIVKQIGPLLPGGVRPFTINGKETLAFTTATGYLGFQVSSITSGQVLYTVPVAGPFPYKAGQAGPSSPSHGISLSPDEKQLWVMDQPNDYVHVFDITGLPASAPKQIADIKLTRPMTGSQIGCTYDCLREGWLQHSLDGRFVYVGDSGDVIDTQIDQSVANLEPLYNSRVYLEVDWSNGLPVATSSRSGVGYVTK